VKNLALELNAIQRNQFFGGCSELARQFKQGPPEAVAECLIGRCGSHPVVLAGAERVSLLPIPWSVSNRSLQTRPA